MASEMLMHITGRGTPMMPVERHASILAANDEAHALSMAAKDEAHASDLVVAHKVIGHCVVARARGEPLPVRPPMSKFRGVSWDQTIAKWRATLTTNGEQTNLGAFRCAHVTCAQ